jgi:hypothetical protein
MFVLGSFLLPPLSVLMLNTPDATSVSAIPFCLVDASGSLHFVGI